MNEHDKARGIIKLYEVLVERDNTMALKIFIEDRLMELRAVGVSLGKSQTERDSNAGAYSELDSFLIRFKSKYDDARELLELDKDKNNSPKNNNSKSGG